jgi:hypothetical protein
MLVIFFRTMFSLQKNDPDKGVAGILLERGSRDFNARTGEDEFAKTHHFASPGGETPPPPPSLSSFSRPERVIFPDIPSLGQVFADYTVAVETHALLLIGYAMFEMLGGNER